VRPFLALVVSAALGTSAARADTPPLAVNGAGGRAVIETAPFALRIEDGRGRVILALASTTSQIGDVLYAPLAFTLGDEPELRYPVLPGQPDTNPTNPPPPQRFSVGEVLEAGSVGRGARVVLASDDPSGRTVTLTVGADDGGTLALEATVSSPDGVAATAATFASGGDEAFHGFGGRRESTDLAGRSFLSWVLDYRFPNPGTAYYYVQPLFVSSRGYGLLLDQSENARWRLGSDTADAWRVAAVGARLRLVVAVGAPLRVIRRLTAITGRERVPPAWSTGPTLSRAVQVVGATQATYMAHVTDDIDHVEQQGLPVDAYAFEGWALLPPDFVHDTIARLGALGLHAVLYLRSYVSNDAAMTEPPGRFDEAVAAGYVATHADGTPYLFPSPFLNASAAVIDYTNPAARTWWTGIVHTLLDTGADGFMNDFGEQVLSDMHFADGTSGVVTHNRFPTLQHQATRAAIDAYLDDHPEREPFFFVRAGSAGRPGSAAYENASFPGDETTDWDPSTGLPSIIPDMLNRAVGGVSGFTTDIGGYADFDFVGPTKELYIRWSQAAALTPFFRVHNSGLTGVRMPWDYDAETLALWTDMANLHRRAQPLLLRLWRKAARSGTPIARPLWLADPGAGRGPRNDDEWLLGRDLLVAPVVVDGATEREVRLPPGCWSYHGEGAGLAGDQTVTVSVPLAELAWFSRCGRHPLGGR